MELIAVISALKYVDEQNIELFTDSKYTKNGIEKWILNWKKNGWKTANKQDVKNIDLWKNLDELNQIKNVQWNWVKGHANNEYNNMADELARSKI